MILFKLIMENLKAFSEDDLWFSQDITFVENWRKGRHVRIVFRFPILKNFNWARRISTNHSFQKLY